MQFTLKSSRALSFVLQRQRLHYLLVVFGILYAAYMLYTFPRWTVDHAYISFRYAYNLVKHGQLNWNVGYDPVEGYTGIMLPLLVAPVIALGGDPAAASQLIGLLAFVVSAILLWIILGEMANPPIVRSIIQTLFLVTPSLYTHVFAGLETMLFTTLILASFYALLRRADTMLPVLLLLTSLTRPEGVLLATLFISVRVIQIWPGNGKIFSFLIRVVFFLIVPGSVYFAWRWSYYGYLLPNTFYVKASSGIFELTGVYWFVAYLLLPLFASAITLPTLGHIKGYGLEIMALLLFSGTLFVLYSRSVLIANYGHRFYMPLYPIGLIILAAIVEFEKRKSKLLFLSLIPLAAQFA